MGRPEQSGREADQGADQFEAVAKRVKKDHSINEVGDRGEEHAIFGAEKRKNRGNDEVGQRKHKIDDAKRKVGVPADAGLFVDAVHDHFLRGN